MPTINPLLLSLLRHFSTNIVSHLFQSLECSRNNEEGEFMMANVGYEPTTLMLLALAEVIGQL